MYRSKIKLLGMILYPYAVIASVMEIPKISEGEIVVDGVLEKLYRQKALKIELNYHWYPDSDTPPPVKTEAFLLSSNDKLYIGIEAFDPAAPDAIRAQYSDRDNTRVIENNDLITIRIDTYGDNRRAFLFSVNPLGVQADAIVDSVGREIVDYSWDAIWFSKGKITNRGYTIEIAIPFREIQYTSKKEWGLSIARSYPRKFPYLFGNYLLDRNNICRICQFQKIKPPTVGEKRKSNLSLIPTIITSTPDISNYRTEVGITAKVPITAGISLHATLNPDFSQIESDAQQLDINTTFALFFPEKRPFFQEGSDFFRSQMRLIFTRTINDPIWGARVVGKIGSTAGGVIVAQDETPALIIPRSTRSYFAELDSKVDSLIGRIRKEFGDNFNAGSIITWREGENYLNRVISGDLRWRITPNDSVSIQLAFSETKYPPYIQEAFSQRANFTGNGIVATYFHGERKWRLFTHIQRFSNGFRADSGFIPRVNTQEFFTFYRYNVWGTQNTWYSLIELGGFFNYREQTDGSFLYQNIGLTTSVQGPLQSEIRLSLETKKEFFEGKVHDDLQSIRLSTSFTPTSSITASLEASYGKAVEYLSNTVGKGPTIRGKFLLFPGRKWEIEINPAFQTLKSVETKNRMFKIFISDQRIIYNFSNNLYFKGFIQYRNVERDTDPAAEFLNSQLFLSYKLNAKTFLFIGYTEKRKGKNSKLEVTDKTYFLKLGYYFNV